MHSLRHYEVRLRQSQRRPYVMARRLLAVAVALVVVVVVSYLLGVI